MSIFNNLQKYKSGVGRKDYVRHIITDQRKKELVNEMLGIGLEKDNIDPYKK